MIITQEDQKKMLPNMFNLELAKAKGLADDSGYNETYYYVLTGYYEYLNKYINQVLSLKDLEEGLDFQDRYFKGVNDEEKDIYQLQSDNKYFYARNTLYIENLTKAEIKEMIEDLTNKEENKIFDFIKKTIKTVISPSDREKETMTNFGPGLSEFLCDQETFVIGMRFEDENKLGLDDETWKQSYAKRRYIINALKEEAPEEWELILGMKCKIIEYDSGTVKKKYNNEPRIGGK